MSDVDGDSQMNSSPDIDEQDEMFPDEAEGVAVGPSTPRNAATYSTGITSELSPPNSQGPSLPRDDNFSTAFSGSPSALNANGKRVYGTVRASSSSGGAGAEHLALHEDKETGYQWAKTEEQPGWEWKNTRAKEEEMRALEQIVDKSSMIRTRYGDPLDPTVSAKKR